MPSKFRLKQIPEDFIVREILDEKPREKWKEKIEMLHGKKTKKTCGKGGEYLWLTMKKTGVDFFSALEKVAGGLGIEQHRIGYAGVKDKKAVTYQTLSLRGVKKEDLQKLKIEGVEFSDFRYMKRYLKLGDHSGNFFKITLRNLTDKESERVRKNLGKIKEKGFVNYYGGQRFGFEGRNHLIGRDILKGKTEILEKFAKKQKTFRLMFIHAYQSWVWNEVAKKLPVEDIRIPVVGHKTRLEDYPESGKTIKVLLKKDGIELEDFRIRGFPELSCEGEERRMVVRPENLRYAVGKDELNRGMGKVVLEFSLPPGSYATVLVEEAAG